MPDLEDYEKATLLKIQRQENQLKKMREEFTATSSGISNTEAIKDVTDYIQELRQELDTMRKANSTGVLPSVKKGLSNAEFLVRYFIGVIVGAILIVLVVLTIN